MRSRTNAILHGKCPRCREGDIFQYPASNLLKFYKINHYCPHCGVDLHPEPGFYQGAMYVSYAFTVALVAGVSFFLYFFTDAQEWVYVTSIIGAMVIAAPINYRYSRIIYLYSFGGIKFDPAKSVPKARANASKFLEL